MKFAESLEDAVVSEWRDKYLRYKVGKKLVKAIERAIHRTDGRLDSHSLWPHTFSYYRKNDFPTTHGNDAEESTPLSGGAASMGKNDTAYVVSRPLQTEHTPEIASLRSHIDQEDLQSNGTLNGTFSTTHKGHVGFNPKAHTIDGPKNQARRSLTPLKIPSGPTGTKLLGGTTDHAFAAGAETPKPGRLRRFPTGFNFNRVATHAVDTIMHPFEMLDLRKQEFMTFMDSELAKVEAFFEQKEAQAGERLIALRKQLHHMRERRNEELSRARRLSLKSSLSATPQTDIRQNRLTMLVKSKIGRDRSDSRSLQEQTYTPSSPTTNYKPVNGDYSRRSTLDTKISYRAAKHKLRLAVQELYRSLELLRSFSVLNRIAFRKLNKKYDKVLCPGQPPLLYWFHEKIDEAHFVNSTLVDEHIEALEDLCGRYLERGNKKLAAEKLRELTKPKGDKSGSALMNGLMVGVGLTFLVEGFVLGIEMLNDATENRRAQVPFLLQLYAGYFLMLYLFSWFCFNCRTWSQHKINYPFIFEFDPRHDLDWRQLSNFPCFFTLVFGVFVWFNFSNIGNQELFVWYPVMLIGLTLAILLLPLPVLHWRSRKWFALAHWRLIFSGLYPVEFRDFFLGDMYCSLTYSIVNAELFFCLYARQWNEPVQCSSRFSRLVGFVATIPLIWRCLQCIRRFGDSRKAFPHLANLLKYTLAIAASVTLSLFRLDNDNTELFVFIAFASISAFYSALWDLFMDFSLLQGGQYPGLRSTLGFNKPWLYYGIMVIDPLLRFSFILSVIFTHNIQHGSYVAFVIAFTEATRRGMWSLFRVENEHCTNITLQKASRDTPLPYTIGSPVKGNSDKFALLFMTQSPSNTQEANTYDNDPEAAEQSMGRQKAKNGLFRNLSRKIAAAHRQDFQKRKDGPTIEEADEPEGIEQALMDDEGSDQDEVNEAASSLGSTSALRRNSDETLAGLDGTGSDDGACRARSPSV